MDTVAEPHLLQVKLETFEVNIITITAIVLVNLLECLAHGEVILTVLVGEDVAALQSGFGEEIDQFLLVERQLVKAGHLVTEHLDVGKAVDSIVKIILCHGESR